VHLEVKQHVESPTAEDLGEFQKVNVEGTREWLRWCTEHEVPGFVYFSTIKAVGESPHAQDEQTATVPTTPYGESKRMAEQLVHAWAAERATRFVLILRPAVIYGPGNRANVFSMVRAIDRGRFFLVGRNDNVKSLISIANVAAAVEHLMGRAAPGAEIYNLVDPVSYPVRDIVRMTASLLGKRSVPSLPYGAARLIASTSEALFRLSGRNLPLNRSRLTALRETTHFDGAKLLASGFVHPQSTEDGLAEMVEWYRTC
jgi:nucleoside-diphosphate-sugar epimerase